MSEPTLDEVREWALARTLAFRASALTKRRGTYLRRVQTLLDELVAEGTLMYQDGLSGARYYYPPNHPTRRRGATHSYSGELRGPATR